MNNKLPEPVTRMMAARDHRLHHYLWHQVRNLWWDFSDSDKSKISSLGWEPPRKARTQPINPQTGRRDPDYHNDSGEDFLYVHRVMIANVNEKLAEIGDPTYPKVIGWQSIPLDPHAFLFAGAGDQAGLRSVLHCYRPQVRRPGVRLARGYLLKPRSRQNGRVSWMR